MRMLNYRMGASLLTLALLSPAAAQDDKPQAEAKPEAEKTVSVDEIELKDDADAAQQISRLMRENKAKDAETLYRRASEKFPDSIRLQSMAYSFYLQNMRNGNTAQAIGYLEKSIDWQLDRTRQGFPSRALPSQIGSFLSLAGRLKGELREAKQQVAEAKLKEALEAAAKVSADNANARSVLTALRTQHVLHLARQDKAEEAKAVLQQELKAAEDRLIEKPDDVRLAMAKAELMQTQLTVLRITGEDRSEAQATYTEFLKQQLEQHPENAQLLGAYVSGTGQGISAIARSEPEKAAAQVDELQKFLSGIETEDQAILRGIQQGERLIASLNRVIETALLHKQLIGRPAFDLDVAAWVNGSPLADADLQGKVVLLDFWAVWCGPCIATFPHLREWNEQYADKGLVILGITRFYNYAWDEEANRARRSQEDVTPEDEQAMLVKFAEQHELGHRFVVTPKNSDFAKRYGVSGIPQAVLIDRDGTIRMIRVGSGEQNAQDLHQMIRKLIDADADTGG